MNLAVSTAAFFGGPGALEMPWVKLMAFRCTDDLAEILNPQVLALDGRASELPLGRVLEFDALDRLVRHWYSLAPRFQSVAGITRVRAREVSGGRDGKRKSNPQCDCCAEGHDIVIEVSQDVAER